MQTNGVVHIIFFGPQGSGKGTQAKLLAARLGLRHFSSGDALRTTAKSATPLGRYLRKQLAAGSLTPISKLMQVFDVQAKLIPARTGIIFDGFARQITEARLFFRRLKKFSREIDCAILIDISGRESVRRLSTRGQCNACGTIYILSGKLRAGSRCPRCGGTIAKRPDDEPEAIRRRLKLYRKRTLPVVNYFKSRGRLEIINGQQTIAAVHKDIIKSLKKRKLVTG